MNPALIGLIGKVAPAALNFAANIGSGYINSNTQESINRQALAHADEAAELAYKRQVDLWQRQASYASPANQMAMMAAAGVNPNIAAGGSIGSIPSAPSVAQASTPSLGMSPTSFGSPLQDLIDIQRVTNESRLNDATIDDLIASADLKVANTEMTKVSMKQIDVNMALLREQEQYYKQLTAGEIAKNGQALIDLIKRKAFIDDEFDKQARDYEMSKAEYAFTVESFALQITGLKLDNQNKRLESALNSQELKRVKAFNKVAADIYQAQSDTAVAQAIINGFDADMKQQFGTFEKYLSFVQSITGRTLPVVKEVAHAPVKGK